MKHYLLKLIQKRMFELYREIKEEGHYNLRKAYATGGRDELLWFYRHIERLIDKEKSEVPKE